MKKILNYNDEGDIGYILEVDVDYPEHLHDLHKDYPMCPEIMTVSEDMLSDLQKDIFKQYYDKETSDEKNKQTYTKRNGQEKICIAYICTQILLRTWFEIKEGA